MTNTLKTALSAAAGAAAIFALAAPAHATSTSDRIELCAAAMDEQGLAARDAYDIKFISASGGGVKKLTLKLNPVAEGEEPKTAVCKVKRGKVTEVVFDA